MKTVATTKNSRPRCDCGKVRSKDSNKCNACHRARMEKLRTEARAVVATGRCPQCGQGLRRNLAMTGWWQCDGYGAEGFRVKGARPCGFQTFTA